MLTHAIVLHAFCDNEFQRNGKDYGCTESKKIIFDTDGDIDDARISAAKQLREQGWQFLPGGITLCPGCEKLGEKPE